MQSLKNCTQTMGFLESNMLSDEQIESCIAEADKAKGSMARLNWGWHFARAIEAKVRDATLEEAAKVVSKYGHSLVDGEVMAERIRALKGG
jgi:hypothetical protein